MTENKGKTDLTENCREEEKRGAGIMIAAVVFGLLAICVITAVIIISRLT